MAAVAGRSSVASLVKVYVCVESLGGWVMRASEFEERYGDYVRRHFQSYATAHTLRKGVRWRYPFVQVSEGMLKVWIKKYRGPEGVVRVSCVAELADRLGDELQEYSDRYPTAFKLVRALQRRVPPVYVSESAAKTWFSRYGGDLREYFHAELQNARRTGYVDDFVMSTEEPAVEGEGAVNDAEALGMGMCPARALLE